MSQTTVAIGKSEDPKEMVATALGLAGIADVCQDKRVLIKMNLSGGPSDRRGAVVSREVTAAVVEYLKPYCRELALCDAGRQSVEHMRQLFEEKTWAAELARELDIPLINLWKSELVTVPVPQPCAHREWTVPKVLLDADVVGSLAVLKASAATRVSLCMKNMFGVLAVQEKHLLHEWINELLVDLLQILRPAFGIIDGYWGWEGGESTYSGNPIQANRVIAGKDVVAVDTVGALLMGRSPEEVRHLRIAARLGLGITDVNQISIVGTALGDARISFRDVLPRHRLVLDEERLAAGIEAALAQA